MKALAAKGGVMGIYMLPYLTESPKQPMLTDYIAHLDHAVKVMGEDHVGIGSDAPFLRLGQEGLPILLRQRQCVGQTPDRARPCGMSISFQVCKLPHAQLGMLGQLFLRKSMRLPVVPQKRPEGLLFHGGHLRRPSAFRAAIIAPPSDGIYLAEKLRANCGCASWPMERKCGRVVP